MKKVPFQKVLVEFMITREMSAFRQLPFLSHYAKRGDLNGHDIESFARPEKFETKIPKKVQ